LYLGDCLEVMREIPSKSIDMTITSPPYDNLRDYHGYTFDFKNIAKELYRVTKDGRVVVWVVGDQTKNFCESLTSFKQAIYFVRKCGFNLLDTMIYHKTTVPPAYPTLRRYGNSFEYMFILSKGKPSVFNPILLDKIHGKKKYKSTYRQRDGSLKKRHTEYVDTDKKKATNLWSYGSGGKDTGHPAVFPEQLANDHIISWSNEGDTVLDPMMGSCTTGVACLRTNRKFIGIEISPEYYKIAKSRIKKELEQGNLL